MTVKLFVEGGGNSDALTRACRKGFAGFITNAGIKKRPRIVSCGSRRNAYESYCTAISNGETAILLVDSEAPIDSRNQQGDDPNQWKPWHHLKNRPGDGWDKPDSAHDDHCHLMVQVMETWFLADRDALAGFFGQGFQSASLPATARTIEGISKSDVYSALSKATAQCKTKRPYGKGEHSFKLLEKVDPTLVVAASPWANRFILFLKRKMDG